MKAKNVNPRRLVNIIRIKIDNEKVRESIYKSIKDTFKNLHKYEILEDIEIENNNFIKIVTYSAYCQFINWSNQLFYYNEHFSSKCNQNQLQILSEIILNKDFDSAENIKRLIGIYKSDNNYDNLREIKKAFNECENEFSYFCSFAKNRNFPFIDYDPLRNIKEKQDYFIYYSECLNLNKTLTKISDHFDIYISSAFNIVDNSVSSQYVQTTLKLFIFRAFLPYFTPIEEEGAGYYLKNEELYNISKKLGICCEQTVEATVDKMLELLKALGCYTKKFYWASDEKAKLIQEEQDQIKTANVIFQKIKEQENLEQTDCNEDNSINKSITNLTPECTVANKEDFKTVSKINQKSDDNEHKNNKTISDLKTNAIIDIKTICQILDIRPSTISMWRRNDSFPKSLKSDNQPLNCFYTQEFYAWIKEKASTLKRYQKYYKTLNRYFKWCEE